MGSMRLYRFHDPNGDGGDPGKGKGGDDLTAKELAELRKFKSDREAADLQAAEAKKKADDEAAKKRGDHEALLKSKDDELKGATERLKALEAKEKTRLDAVGKRNEERIKALPEKFRKVVPAGLDADATADFLDNLAGAIGEEDVATGARRPTGTASKSIPAECRAEFDRYGAHLGGTVEDWYTNNWKPRQKRPAAEA